MKASTILFALLAAGLPAACSDSSDLPRSTRPDGAPEPTTFSQFTDIPIPVNASMSMDQSLLIGHGDEWVGRLVYTSRGNAGSIYDLYESDMPAFGWHEITSVRASISVQTWQRGERVATVQIRDITLGEETIVTVAPAKGPGSGGATTGSRSNGTRPSTR